MDRRGVTYTPNATQTFLLGTGLKDLHIEAMAKTMRSRRDTRHTGSNDRNTFLGETSGSGGRRRGDRGKDPIDDRLKQDIEKAEEIQDRGRNEGRGGELALGGRHGGCDGAVNEVNAINDNCSMENEAKVETRDRERECVCV